LRRADLLLFPVFLLMASPAPPQSRNRPAEDQNQLDVSKSLFGVMAAVNAGGFDAELDSPLSHPLRKKLREYVAAQNPESLAALRRYVRDHKPKDPGAELSQYISYGLSSNGPPDFSFRIAESALPPDAAPLWELTPLLVRFYREANLEKFWEQSQPEFEQALQQYQAPISRAMVESNAYLRNISGGFVGRRFQIYVELLGSPNQVQTRSYLDDVFVVVTPSAEPRINQIRHAYLHFVLEPLLLKYSDQVLSKHALGDYALGSSALEEHYKNDFVLLATECFIKAVESRLDRKPALVDEALREGFVLTPAFAEQLEVYEKQEQAMRLYFPDLVLAIDLKREEKRLENLQFVSERSNRRVRSVTREQEVVLTGAAKTLDEAEKAYTDRDLPRARETYLRVLKETTEKPMHAKAYYGLARIAVLERDPELGDRLFRKVLELEPDPSTRSWSLLYVARLADSQGDREQAMENYRAALAVEGAPESVRAAAEKGLKEAFVKK
jgi:tetratricopeptide (TPR) repeat protein